ncbi:hypothetical protein C5U62_04125 [Pseudomonas protegens]|uniref:Uncharacterized protein n=1 Tax=Pseudomonas protegens TaxID=380021 RepID=A0A2T6GSR0_9PSED|nr:hypothetical protein C5U62_04125 [Pseudomonas protegens]
MPAKRPASPASPLRAPSLASQLLPQSDTSRRHARPRRSRLAGEEARNTCITLADAFAGQPAPTTIRCIPQARPPP